MSRNADPSAIVQPAFNVDAFCREVRKLHIVVRDAERGAADAEATAEKARDKAARARLELGRKLVEARKAWPARGPNAKGWGEFLRDAGIGEDAARDWMRLAGYVEEISRPSGDGREISERVPTRREVERARRPRVEEEDEEDEAPPQNVTIHAQTVQMVTRGPVAVNPSPLPSTPGALTVAVAAPRLRRVHALLCEAAREWETMLDEFRPLVEGGKIPRHAIDPLLRLPDATKLREQARQIAGGTPAGECRWCGGADPQCTGCKGRMWLDGDRLALATSDAEAAARRLP